MRLIGKQETAKLRLVEKLTVDEYDHDAPVFTDDDGVTRTRGHGPECVPGCTPTRAGALVYLVDGVPTTDQDIINKVEEAINGAR